ncbi:MAG: DEAD/DEAH box helicase [Oligoflexales bacterium]|nr:DEAD/DEAH box helicase [Oligoflexales bacterium]
MQNQTNNSGLLDYFYQHLDQDDWLDGIELYQSSAVDFKKNFHGLIYGQVKEDQVQFDVRLKLHPNGNCIQWIECSCPKNRRLGTYCSHIVALMLYIDRERSELFANLNLKMPLKTPVNKRSNKTAKAAINAESNEQLSTTKNTPTSSILDHLKDLIKSVKLVHKGPFLRVQLAIKQNQSTHYDLAIDDAARFISDPANLKFADAEVKQLKFQAQEAFCALRLQLTSENEIQIEKVIAIRDLKKSFNSQEFKLSAQSFIAKLSSNDDEATKVGTFHTFSAKSVARYFQKEYFLDPNLGFFRLHEAPKDSWVVAKSKDKISGNDVISNIKSGFKELRALAPLLLCDELASSTVIEDTTLQDIKVVNANKGWFELDPSYGTGHFSISMVALLKHFQKTKQKFIRQGDKWITIPDIITEHEWEIDEDLDILRTSAIGLFRLQANSGDFDRFVGKKQILNLIQQQLNYAAPIDRPNLDNTNLRLRDYQLAGVDWLWWLYQRGLHGLLADEMGLGKTHQTMALLSCIASLHPEAQFLVICPTSVIDHWFDKMSEFAPALNPQIYHGPKRGSQFNTTSSGPRTIITSYGIVIRDIKEIAKQRWHGIVLDEAHLVKNSKTATYKAVCALNGDIRICLTGTPIENRLLELKSIYDFLLPGYLGSDEYFKKNIVNPIEIDKNLDAEIFLQRLAHPFKLRRIKTEVLKDLPEKIEDFRHCSLSDEQVKLYRETLALKASPLLDQMRDQNSSVPFLHVFATINLLKQICDHPALLFEPADYEKYHSGKFELAKELIDEALGSGQKIVIFSQYVNMVEIFIQYLAKINVSCVALTGATRQRGKVIEKFQTDPNCKVFVGSLLAGGMGIDLTAASLVLHYDRWWNASKENQATDRVHRIGQNKNVQVLKLITKGTLEEKIDLIIKRKQTLFDKFVNKDEDLFKNLSRDELIELLA